MKNHSDEKNNYSNDSLDAIAALTLIGVIVAGVVFWLNSMPY